MTILLELEQWLHTQGYRLNTISGFVNGTEAFLNWCEMQMIKGAEAGYSDVLGYINDCKSRGNGQQTVRFKTNALKHFYNYCIYKGDRTDNPVMELRLQSSLRTVPHDLLSKEQLEAIYQQYPGSGITGKRNKAMLGLLIYQGITTAELARIEITDVKLQEGKIYIPAVKRSNGRTLALEGHQVVQLQNYILTIRPVLLAMSDKVTNLLFVSTGKSERLSNSYARMLARIRQVNKNIKTLQQIRASVITGWIKQYGIRQAQYLSGHKYVSSTDRYGTDKLEGLQAQLEQMHPLG